MNLIEIYIQEVTRRLPEKGREDIARELRSTIDDMLPDEYNEENVKVVLEKLGNPATLASQYREQPMHLIGPRYFDVYVSLLKMILPIATVISFIAMIAEYVIGYHGQEAVMNVVLDVVGLGIGRIIEVGIHVFFWVTLVFAILERTEKGTDAQPLTANMKKWTPDDLKNISYIPKKKAIPKFEVFGSFMWTAIWATTYFYGNQLVGIYEGGRDGLEFVMPAFNQEVLLRYWPIVLIVIGFEIALALYKLTKGQWTKRMSICNAALQLFGAVVFIVIVMNPNLMNKDFITYMADLSNISTEQFKSWIIGGGIFFYLVAVVVNIFDGFRKMNIR